MINGIYRDYLNFLSKTTTKRIVNAFTVVFSYILSKSNGNHKIVGTPIAIAIEPTTSCNLRCPECPSGLRSFTRPRGMLEPRFFKNIIDQIGDRLWYLTFYFQGEPYLNKNFLEMVTYASKKGIYTATSTNAHYLDAETAALTVKSGLDKLIISIDGTTQDVYEQYRVGGQLDQVIAGTKAIIHAKKEQKSSKPFVLFQYLVVKPNEHQIEDAKRLAKSLGVDSIAFKTAQIYDYQNGNVLIPTIEKYSRYKKMLDGTYQLKNRLIDHCWKMWHSCVITWNGAVVPCCFDKDAEYALGQLETHSFTQIWQSESYVNFRKQLISSRKSIEMCKNCTEGTKVWG